MLSRYYVCKHASLTGEHVVHRDVCPFEALPDDRDELGLFEACREAVALAIFRGYVSVNGCYHCANECHVRRDPLPEAADE